MGCQIGGDLAGVQGYLPGIVLDVGVVDGNDVVDQEREFPRGKVLTPLHRFPLRRLNFP